jgi:hypothetical protein
MNFSTSSQVWTIVSLFLDLIAQSFCLFCECNKNNITTNYLRNDTSKFSVKHNTEWVSLKDAENGDAKKPHHLSIIQKTKKFLNQLHYK